MIGRVYSINRNNSNVADLLKIEKTEYIHLEYRPIDLKVLSKDRLLIVYCVIKLSKFITLHDEYYNVIKKIEEIDGQSISKIEEIAINEEKREVYFLEQSKHRIIVTDFELNFIKYFGSYGNGDNQFNYPSSICFYNEFLYVCETIKKRIKKFNQNYFFCLFF